MSTTQASAPPRRRARTIAATIAGVVLVVGGAIVVIESRGPTISEIPDEGPWSIGISHPQGDTSECTRDPAVSSALMTADLPSSRTAIQLKGSATRDDVERVLDCLGDALSGGDLTVSTQQR